MWLGLAEKGRQLIPPKVFVGLVCAFVVYETYRGFAVLGKGAGTLTTSPGRIARVVALVENEAARGCTDNGGAVWPERLGFDISNM